MDKKEVYAFIKNVLSESTMLQPDEINMEQFLEADLGLDSIGLASVLTKFEPVLEAHDSPNEFVHSLLACEKVADLVEAVWVFRGEKEKV